MVYEKHEEPAVVGVSAAEPVAAAIQAIRANSRDAYFLHGLDIVSHQHPPFLKLPACGQVLQCGT